jgi:hypothetical protein
VSMTRKSLLISIRYCLFVSPILLIIVSSETLILFLLAQFDRKEIPRNQQLWAY